MNPNKWLNAILSFHIYVQNNDDDDVENISQDSKVDKRTFYRQKKICYNRTKWNENSGGENFPDINERVKLKARKLLGTERGEWKIYSELLEKVWSAL